MNLSITEGATLDLVVQGRCPACLTIHQITYKGVTDDDVPALGSVFGTQVMPVCSCCDEPLPTAYRVTAYLSGYIKPDEYAEEDEIAGLNAEGLR